MGLNFRLVSQKIEDAYARLSPQLKRAARYALDHPDDIALLSMRKFAVKADVQPATMVRLVKVLGIDGYATFQEAFRSRLRTRPEEPYSKSASSIQARGTHGAHSLFNDMMSMEHANLSSLSDELGFDALSECANLIGQARHVYVGGIRSCYPAAFYFQYACRMFKDNITLLNGHGGTFADDLRGSGKGDVFLVISFTPYSRSILQAVDYASDRGVRVIALTDSTLSPLLTAKDALPLIVRTSSPSFFHSVVPAMSVVQALMLLLIAQGGEEAMDKLSESEAQLDTFQTYWSSGERRPIVRK